jgi:hypothetical protein
MGVRNLFIASLHAFSSIILLVLRNLLKLGYMTQVVRPWS